MFAYIILYLQEFLKRKSSSLGGTLPKISEQLLSSNQDVEDCAVEQSQQQTSCLPASDDLATADSPLKNASTVFDSPNPLLSPSHSSTASLSGVEWSTPDASLADPSSPELTPRLPAASQRTANFPHPTSLEIESSETACSRASMFASEGASILTCELPTFAKPATRGLRARNPLIGKLETRNLPSVYSANRNLQPIGNASTARLQDFCLLRTSLPTAKAQFFETTPSIPPTPKQPSASEPKSSATQLANSAKGTVQYYLYYLN